MKKLFEILIAVLMVCMLSGCFSENVPDSTQPIVEKTDTDTESRETTAPDPFTTIVDTDAIEFSTK